MIIRKITDEDLDELYELFIYFKKELVDYQSNNFKIFKTKMKQIDKIKQNIINIIKERQSLFLVIEKNNHIIGFGYGKIKIDDHMIFEKVKFGELGYIWIDKQFRNKGLSSKIKNIIFNWFKEKNCKFVKLSVLNKNPAKKIYMKWGFETILCDMKKLI